MAKETLNPPDRTISKLPRIPKGSKIQKRALNRSQPSSSHHILYISSSTPFVSAIKRVRKQLDASLRRETEPAAPKNASLYSRIQGLQHRQQQQQHLPGAEASGVAAAAGAGGFEVRVLGTGKAVEKTLKVASYFQQERDCVVEVRTRTVGTVDDVVAATEEGEDEDEGPVEEESRVRKLSCLEVKVKLR